jgi:hypothetical protein
VPPVAPKITSFIASTPSRKTAASVLLHAYLLKFRRTPPLLKAGTFGIRSSRAPDRAFHSDIGLSTPFCGLRVEKKDKAGRFSGDESSLPAF